MGKNWKITESPTMQAQANIYERDLTERTQIMKDRLGSLHTIKAELLAQISVKNTTDTNQHLQSAMECIAMAIIEIEVTEQRLKGE